MNTHTLNDDLSLFRTVFRTKTRKTHELTRTLTNTDITKTIITERMVMEDMEDTEDMEEVEEVLWLTRSVDW